jgi:hypothetical protein
MDPTGFKHVPGMTRRVSGDSIFYRGEYQSVGIVLEKTLVQYFAASIKYRKRIVGYEKLLTLDTEIGATRFVRFC